MWLSKREWVRHQRELQAARKRAADAEADLREERRAKDALVVQLASRIVTKHGGYGLSGAEPEPAPLPVHPKRFVREPSLEDEARLEYYKQCYREKGLDEDDAVVVWETEMRGETPHYPYESEIEQ